MEKKRRILPYVAYAIRILFGLACIAIAIAMCRSLLDMAYSNFSYALCFMLPVLAVVIVSIDLYFRYQDIKALNPDKDKDKIEF